MGLDTNAQTTETSYNKFVPTAPLTGGTTGQYGTAQEQQQQQQQQQPGMVVRHCQEQPRVNEWSFGLCDCLQDISLCCDVYWCSVCQQSRQHASIIDGSQDSFNAPVCALLTCAGFWLGSWVCCVHAWYLRDALRAQHGIKGNTCTDCLASCFCTPCVLCQTHRQVRGSGGNPGYTCCESTTPVSRPPGVVQSGFVGSAPPAPVQGVPVAA